MIDKLYAADLMSREVRTLPVAAALTEALAILDATGYGQLPVLDGDRPVGLLTERDCRHALQAGRAGLPVGELASPLPCLLAPEAPLSEVLQGLQGADSLLIIEPDGHLAGIITYWDVLRVARLHLLVAEAELLLRKAVATAMRGRHGADWWPHVRPDLRNKAEEEHEREGGAPDPTAEHMLGHTSFWTLIEIYRTLFPKLPQSQIEAFHRVREWRNRVAHLYLMSEAEQAQLIQETLAMRDALEEPPSPVCPT